MNSLRDGKKRNARFSKPSQSDAWFFLERVYIYLSKTHDTKDAADVIEEIMVELFNAMSLSEKRKVQIAIVTRHIWKH